MKKRLIIVMIIVVICVGVFSACDNKDNIPDNNQSIFTVSYKTTGGGRILGDTEQTVNKGENATTVIAIANEGYRFIKWSDDVETQERTDTKITENISITAIFDYEVFTVRYKATNGGFIKGDAYQTVFNGESATPVTAIAEDGYHFVKWSDDVETQERTDIEITENISVTAVFELEPYTITYNVTEGGHILGETKQTVNEGENATTVTAIAEDGYRFIKWSDDVETQERTDTKITENISVTAVFEVITKTFNFEYNNATVVMDMPKNLKIDYFYNKENFKFFVPNRVNSIFNGWYADKDFVTKITDENGIITYDKNLTNIQSDTLYAKFTLRHEVKYKFLMIFITEVEGEFVFNNDSVNVHTKMTDFERNLYELLSKKFEQQLEDIFKGLIDFEIDTYFTHNVITSDNFGCFEDPCYINYLNSNLKPWTIAEIPDRYWKDYRNILTTVRKLDCNEIFEKNQPRKLQIHHDTFACPKFGGVNGEAVLDSIYSDLDPICLLERKEIPNEDKAIYNNWWNNVLSLYRHAFIHSVEQMQPSGFVSTSEFLSYDEFLLGELQTDDYYLSQGKDPVLEKDKLYLLNQAQSLAVKTIQGIPYEFWDNTFYIDIQCISGEGGYITSESMEQISLGGDWHVKTTAIPFEGYRFVKWDFRMIDFGPWSDNMALNIYDPSLDLTINGVFSRYTEIVSIMAVFEKIE